MNYIPLIVGYFMILWIVLAALTAVLAIRSGRNPLGWLVLALLFAPVAFSLLSVLPTRRGKAAPGSRLITIGRVLSAMTVIGLPVAALSWLLRNHTSRRRLAVLVGAAVTALALAVLFSGVTVYLVRYGGKNQPFPTDHVRFALPDWETDILSDPDYIDMAKLPIMYSVADSNLSQSYALTRGNPSVRDSAKLFLDYFDAVVRGDADRVNAMYTDVCIKERKGLEQFALPHKAFPMQRVYDIVVTYMGTVTDDMGAEADLYSLSYRISKNDGMFRNDVGSNAMRNQYAIVVHTDDGYQIDSIDFYPPDFE